MNAGRHAARIPEHSVGVLREGKALGRQTRVIVNLSGRGDKDVEEVLRVRGRG